MAIVSLEGVHVAFESQVVLDGLDWRIHRGEKIGLVGPNGSGKTTLFRLICGELEPQMGRVQRARRLQVAYLPQEPDLDTAGTVFEEVSRTFENIRRLEERVAEVAQAIADRHETDEAAELMAEYDELCHRLEAAGGYHYETTVQRVLGGLGFGPEDYDRPIGTLSGGQKCRVALARLLLAEADLLLLDEPTNHLDIEATEFLESFLAGYHGSAVIVSHDRYLLDRVVGRIADLEGRRITVYPCGYSDYAETKRVRQMTAGRDYEKQQEWLRHQREYAERVKADKSRSKQAQGRLKRLERMEREGQVLEQPEHARRRMAIDFTPSRRAGEMVLRCENVFKAYGEVELFRDFEFEVFRGEKVGIIGPNGVGKTTLLKMAMRRVEPDAGRVRLYENLDVGYYDQEQVDLDPDLTVLDVLMPRRMMEEEARLRSFLAKFLFVGDDVFKRVGDLSGGEQSRVTLAKLVFSNPQVLVLDEPTNHLDIPASEALEEALIDYEGAVLMVSHDRYFLDRVVNRLLVLPERGRYEVMTGNWSTYEAKLAAAAAARRAAQEAARAEARQAAKLARRKEKTGAVRRAEAAGSPHAAWSLDRLEEEIVAREDRLAEIERAFADPDIYRDAERARTVRADAEALRRELATLNAEWEARADGQNA